MRTLIRMFMLVALAGLFTAPVQAQDAKPIRFIVPFPPGGGGDILSRLIARKLSEVAGLSVVVDNRAGAGGIIGTDFAAKAAPDGLTLVMGTPSPITIAPYLQKQMPYDPIKDLAPVSLIAVIPAVVLVNSSSSIRTIKDLLDEAQAKPGTLTYSSSGSCGTGCLAGLMLEKMGKAPMLHVPYKGSNPAALAVMSGEVNIYVSELITALPLIQAGRVRAIAVTSERRSSTLPDLPTVAETLPGYSAGPFFGILAPGSTPQPLVNLRHQQMSKVLRDPEVVKALQSMGGDVLNGTPLEFATLIKTETIRWGRVLEGVKLQ
jgi:tripartite-type tricarboxylate transporter receptor subunit TctC